MIQLRFTAHDLRSNVRISYDEKFKTVKDVTAVDLNGTLKPFLPKGIFNVFEKLSTSCYNCVSNENRRVQAA